MAELPDEGPEQELDPLEAAWAELDARWEDPDAHAKLLALADVLERLAEAGKRYRAVASEHPDRAQIATKQIDALLGLAMTRVTRSEKTEPKPVKRRIEWIAFGVSASLIAAALWSMLRGL